MFIEIEKELFEKIKKVMKSRNKNIYKELEEIKELKTISQATNNDLQNARKIKTQRIQEKIKASMIEIKKENLEINKYRIHKRTGIAYITLKKYFDEILKDIK